MHMDITQAQSCHLPAIAAIERDCFGGEAWPAELIARLLPRFTVAAEDGRVLGYLALSSVLDEGCVDNVAVAPAYRRRGVADALLDATEKRAADMGLATLTLEVRAGNEPAICLYEKHGFITVGRRKNYYERPREDAILMTRTLSAHAENRE